jgi:hypothetical protein
LEAFKESLAKLVDQSSQRLKYNLDTWIRSDQQVAATAAELAKKEVRNSDMAENVMKNSAAFIKARSGSLYRDDRCVGGTRTKKDQEMVETILIAAVWEDQDFSKSRPLAAAFGVSPQLVDKCKKTVRDKVLMSTRAL